MRQLYLFLILALGGCAQEPALPPVPGAPPVGRPVPPPPGFNDFATGNFDRPLSASDAEAILSRTEIFAYGGMNRFPHPEAFSVLLRQPDALEIARRLARDARPTGRLFALCMLKALEERVKGLHQNRPEQHEIEALAVELSEAEGRIEVMESDVWNNPSMGAMVVRILNRRLWTHFDDESSRAGGR